MTSNKEDKEQEKEDKEQEKDKKESKPKGKKTVKKNLLGAKISTVAIIHSKEGISLHPCKGKEKKNKKQGRYKKFFCT